jgi:hypothetical protein
MSSPLNANATASLLQNIGLNINPVAQSYMGISQNNTSYTLGTTVNSTCLYNLTRAINLAYPLIGVGVSNITSATYDNLISIGSSTIPALGNSKPPTYVVVDPSGSGWTGQVNTGYAISGSTGQGQDATWIPYNTTNTNSSVTRWGYLRLHALQAQNEFNYNNDSATGSIRYQDFVSSFMNASSYIKSVNATINTFANAPEYLDGIYSNMNDLISSDVTGVSLSTKLFGQDCITLGKAIDLSNINKFGLPSALLQNLRKYNCITQSLSLALLSSGLSSNEIELIYKGSGATTDQEQKIYSAFLIILGQDLVNILIPLNCKTLGLESLADLLNIRKIFPNSYRSLTVPLYNLTESETNSKTYYPIFDGDSVSNRINSPSVKRQVGTIIIPGTPSIAVETTSVIQDLPTGFDSYLVDILPAEVALSAGAFRYTMLQITNIQFTDFERFAQVVFNIETTKNLNLINGTNIPTNTILTNQSIALIGLGSGPNNTYTMSDFFGCMSGLPYNWKKLTDLILSVQTTTLTTIYTNLYNTILAAAPGLDAAVQGYITAANAEILNIYNTNTQTAQVLNDLYEQFGSQLMREQRARFIALAPVPVPRDSRLNPYPTMILAFADNLQEYAKNTLPHMEEQTLEAISNLNTAGGQSIVGGMRESRNQTRLQSIGVPLNNSIPSVFNNEQELLCNGVVNYTVNGTSYTTIPSVLNQSIGVTLISPEVAGTLLMPGSPLPNQINPYYLPAGENLLVSPTIESIEAPVYVTNNGVPLDTGKSQYPSSFAGSPATNLVPINLNTTYASGMTLPATLSIPEAINQVIHCNCDCWLG